MIDLLAVAGIVVLVWIAAVVLTVRALRRRNAVARLVPSTAPLWWLASPGTSAQLHRRLRRSVAAVRVAVPLPRRRAPRLAIQDLADDIEREAAAIDHELVAVHCLTVTRRVELRRALIVRTAEVERLAARVVTMASDRPAFAGPPAIDRIRERVDALQAAHAELAHLERAAGLSSG